MIRQARLARTHSDEMTTGRLRAEIRIKGEHTRNIRFRDPKGTGELRHRLNRHMSELNLYSK